MSTFASPLTRTVVRLPKPRHSLAGGVGGASRAPHAAAAFEPFAAHDAAGRTSAPASVPVIPRVQAKLRIGGSNDRFEREADQIAEQVVSGAGPSAVTHAPDDAAVRRKCDACATEEKDEERLRRKPATSTADGLAPGGAASPEWSGRFSQVRGQQGHGLPPGVISYMQPRLGADLSTVQIHHDAGSAELARAIGARAFTVGRDVFFGAGEYQPHTTAGQRLLAHELVHTLQNSLHPPGAATIRRAPAPQQGPDPTKARKLVVGWIAGLVVAIAAGDALSDSPHGIAERIVAGRFIGQVDGKGVSIQEFARSIESGEDIAISDELLHAILRASGLQISVGQARARLEAAPLAAPILDGLTQPGVAGLFEPEQDPFEMEGGFEAPEEPIEVPGTAPDPAEEAAEPAVAPPMDAPEPKASDDKSAGLQGGIAVLSAGTRGPSAYIPAGSVALGRKSDARLRSAVEDEARFGLFACFPDLSPVRAAVMLRSGQLTLEIPPVAQLAARDLSEVTVALNIPRLEAQLAMDSRCKGGKGLIELANARTLGQLSVISSIVETGSMLFGGGVAGKLEKMALARAERRLAKSRAKAAKKELGKARRAALEPEQKGKQGKRRDKEKSGTRGMWGCEDVRCNVYPNPQSPPEEKCPDRVIGSTPYIHPNKNTACKAAQKHANSQLPEGCIKRHCNCRTKCRRK